MRSRIVQCHGEAQRNSWGGVSEIVDREAGHSRRRAAAVRCGGAVAMSTLPILDYGAPAEGAGAGGEGAQASPPLSRRTRCRPTGRRSRAKPRSSLPRARTTSCPGRGGSGPSVSPRRREARRALLRLPPGTNARRPRGRPRSAPPPDRALPERRRRRRQKTRRQKKKNGDDGFRAPARRSPPRKTPNRDEPRRPQSRASR